jgi:hypothetical protein
MFGPVAVSSMTGVAPAAAPLLNAPTPAHAAAQPQVQQAAAAELAEQRQTVEAAFSGPCLSEPIGPSARPGSSSSSSRTLEAVPSGQPVCLLKVLDVSGCAALAQSAADASVFKLFRQCVGAMPHLEGE